MPIVPEKLFTGTLVTLTHAVTHTHYTDSHHHFILHTHTYRGQSSAVRLTGNNRDYTVSLSLSTSSRVLSLSFRVKQEDWSHGQKKQPPALTDAWINSDFFRDLSGIDSHLSLFRAALTLKPRTCSLHRAPYVAPCRGNHINFPIYYLIY